MTEVGMTKGGPTEGGLTEGGQIEEGLTEGGKTEWGGKSTPQDDGENATCAVDDVNNYIKN